MGNNPYGEGVRYFKCEIQIDNFAVEFFFSAAFENVEKKIKNVFNVIPLCSLLSF